MQSKVNPNGVQEFFPVWFNKKKLLKALSDLGLLTNWKYMKITNGTQMSQERLQGTL